MNENFSFISFNFEKLVGLPRGNVSTLTPKVSNLGLNLSPDIDRHPGVSQIG